MKPVPTLVSAADLAAYAPANHSGTSNVRVIGPETVGATALEVLVGTIVKSHGARPHAHPDLEQCAYMIEGTGESAAGRRVEALGPRRRRCRGVGRRATLQSCAGRLPVPSRRRGGDAAVSVGRAGVRLPDHRMASN